MVSNCGTFPTMKLVVVLSIFFVISTSGCGSNPSTPVRTTPATQPTKTAAVDELDIAIRDASDYLNDNIPKGSKIVILNIQSSSPNLSDYIIDELIANAVNDKIFTVVDRQQLDAIRSEQNFQLSGEVDDNDALTIGKFFGAQTIVSGRVNQVGDRYRMTIRALEVQTAQVQGQYNRNITAGATITALMASGGTSPAATTNTTPASPPITGTMVPGSSLTEKLDWLTAVASQRSDESAEILSKILIELNQKRNTGNITRDDEQMVQAVIVHLGEIGRPSARTALIAVGSSNWTPSVKALANNALRQIR